jgi:nitrogenase molybdenum-iron protein NifN
MAVVEKYNRPLVVQPLKTSPGTGATLACLGFQKSIPLLHGAQGCGAFTKIYLIQHLREPIPVQNTAIDQMSAVMGGDENLHEALVLLCQKHAPELILVLTSGLTEMQGTDPFRVVAEFRLRYPQYQSIRIAVVETPDFSGTMQTGFAGAVDGIVRQIVSSVDQRSRTQQQVRVRQQVNVLCSVALTGADVETLKRYCAAFEIDAIIVPDLSLSLDGHLNLQDFSPTSTGGTSMQEVELMSDSRMTLVFGESMLPTAQWLRQRFGIPYFDAGMAMDMVSVDKLIMQLAELSSRSVPGWINRQRQRLQDALLDTHLILSDESYTIALEPDLAVGYARLLMAVGGHLSQVVTTMETSALGTLTAGQLIVGDLSVLEVQNPALTLITNSHGAQLVAPGSPVLRVGYPCYDQFGNMDIRQIGYEGIRERLFALANLRLRAHGDEVAPHISRYRFGAHEVVQKGTGSA